MERLLTHYLRNEDDSEDDPDNWAPLYFLTKDPAGRFFFGFESIEIPAQEVERRLTVGEVARLDTSWPVTDAQELWKTPNADIWLTTAEVDPVEDPNRILVSRGFDPPFLSRHEIISRRKSPKTLLYIPDGYLKSPTYASFSSAVAAQLAGQLNARVLPQPGILATWEALASLIDGGPVDFAGLAFYLHPNRALEYAVVQFATLETFTLYFDMESPSIGYATNPLLDDSLSVEERIIKGLKTNPKLEVGILERTAATLEIFRIFRDADLNWFAEHGLRLESDPKILKAWLVEEVACPRVIVCDHNYTKVLDKAVEAINMYGRKNFEYNTIRTRLKFRRPLPVGFVYPRRDQRWECEIRTATASVVSEFLFAENKYQLLESELLSTLQVKLLSRDQLCRSLRIPMPDTIDDRSLRGSAS
jgi:hypothetical protein